MYIDLTYIVLVLPAVLLSLWASWNVNSTYRRYSQNSNSRGLTAAEAARRVLNANGLSNVPIECIPGELTDHFDPSANVVRLSEGVFGSCSTAAIGVACHEVGHAIQHATGYLPVRIRSAIVPITNIGAKLSVPLIMVGLLLSGFSQKLIVAAYIGILLFSLCAVFQVVTLPTEFNASRRALVTIQDMNLLTGEELTGARRTLRAAALTYVAALATTLVQLLRFIILVNARNNRRR